MSTISPELLGLLTQFGNSVGVNSDIYKDLSAAINASQDLADQLTTAIQHNGLTQISFDPNSGAIDFKGGNTIELGGQSLTTILNDFNSSDPATQQLGIDGLVQVVAHETVHANDAATLAQEQSDLRKILPPADAGVAQNDRMSGTPTK